MDKTLQEKLLEVAEFKKDKVFENAPPTLTKLKPQPKLCDACGKMTDNGQHLEMRHHKTNQYNYWRTKCVTCGMTKNPETGDFDLNQGEAMAFLREYYSIFNKRQK